MNHELSQESLEQFPLETSRLPEGWSLALIADIASEIAPGFASGEHDSDGRGHPHLRPMNIDRSGRIDLSVVKSVPSTQDRTLLAGDILFNNTNSPDLVGKTALIGTRENGFAFSNHMTRIRVGEAQSRSYVAHFLHFLWMSGYMRHRCTNHVNQASISSKTLANTVPLLVPPSSEQARIVEKLEELLSDLDAGVAELKAAQRKLAQYRRSLLKAAVGGALTADWRAAHGKRQQPREERADKAKHRVAKTLPTLPESWRWETASNVGEILLGRQRAPQFLTGRHSHKYLRVANIKDDRIDFCDLASMDFDEVHFKKYVLESGDILVSEGQSPELVGQSAIFRGHNERLCFQKTLHRFRASEGITSPEFAQIVFRSNVSNGVFRELASITTNIAHLTLEKFKASPFPLPPVDEQSEIVLRVESFLAGMTEAEQAIEESLRQANAQRKNLLIAAFSGDLVPQDPSDKPASELLARIRAERASNDGGAPRRRRKTS